MNAFHFHQGTLPILISIPHVGTEIPDEIAGTMMPIAREVHDTDWHLDQLYAFAKEMGASVLAARYSRYVIDLNRPEDNANLYPGQNTTGLCPIDTFDLQPLYQPGREPSAAEIERRTALYWLPYHAMLRIQLTQLRALHKRVLLWDAHSIRSVVPRFFEGTLPDLNFGTADGKSCAAGSIEAVLRTAATQTHYTHVHNGRFKGGHITRHYGDPARGINAIQLEMTQRTYMQESPPFAYDEAKAAQVTPLLRSMIEAAVTALKP
jgi:N-formylglutamate deformylase